MGTGATEERFLRLKEENRWLKEELRLRKDLWKFSPAAFSLEKVFNNFLGRVARVFETDAGTVFIVDRRTSELVFKAVRGAAREKLLGKKLKPGVGIAGVVAATGKPKLIRDVRSNTRWKTAISRKTGYMTKDILAAPILARSGRVAGVVELLNKSRHRGFTDLDLERLSALTMSVTGITDYARLWHETRIRVAQLGLLNEVSHLVNSTLDPKKVRASTVEAATRLVDCEAGSLLLADAKTGELFFEVALGKKGEEVEKIRLKKGEGVAGWVVQKGKPAIIPDCRHDPRWSKRADRSSRFTTRSMMCVPVKIKGSTIGALQVINKRHDTFHQTDLEQLSALSDQVAMALQNSRLFEQLRETLFETSESLADAIELRDAYTGGHTRRVTSYSLAIGRRLGLEPDEMENLRFASILHDIGKLGVDDRILRKKTRLNDQETELMKKHPHVGSAILKGINYLKRARPGIRSHHERADGQGYPDGIPLEKIPIVARIISVADTYDAITSDRPYRKGLDRKVAALEIQDCAGTQFDPAVAEAFIKAFKAGEISGRKERM